MPGSVTFSVNMNTYERLNAKKADKDKSWSVFFNELLDYLEATKPTEEQVPDKTE